MTVTDTWGGRKGRTQGEILTPAAVVDKATAPAVNLLTLPTSPTPCLLTTTHPTPPLIAPCVCARQGFLLPSQAGRIYWERRHLRQGSYPL